MTRSADGARDHLVALAEGASRVGLRINMDKTQCTVTPALPQDMVVRNLGTLEQVKCFKYLGLFMSSSAADLKNARRGQAWAGVVLEHEAAVAVCGDASHATTTYISIHMFACTTIWR